MDSEHGKDTLRPPRTVNPDCLFCKIVAGQVPADVVAATDGVLAFRDVNPQAPVHVLVIPRDHHVDVAALAQTDGATLVELVRVGSRIAADEVGGEFRLVFNTGPKAGQIIFHTHGHVLGGRAMTWPPG